MRRRLQAHPRSGRGGCGRALGGRQEGPAVYPETKPAGAPQPWGRATEDHEARAVPRAPGGGRPLHRLQGALRHSQGAQLAQAPRRRPDPAADSVRPAGAGPGAVLQPGRARGTGPGGPPGPAPGPPPAPAARGPGLLAPTPAALMADAHRPRARGAALQRESSRSGLGDSRQP
ncbi:nutritionally-regulated adipose and cardiac enriched protein homolog isoform X1 [Kogia breviceps]|uniref:nutritionally-regulated adipose and cardiac enriched protein homolog isoform X1 n=1 Tax=Kogia breviceps TaxID=27615 RepID=UPI0034D24D77